MSTKTTIKRIALVAAASLAIGGFSAVSANAYSNVDNGDYFNVTAAYDITSATTATNTVVTQVASPGGYVQLSAVANAGSAILTYTVTGSTFTKASAAFTSWYNTATPTITGTTSGGTVSGAGSTATATGTLLAASAPSGATSSASSDAVLRVATTAPGTITIVETVTTVSEGVTSTYANHSWTILVSPGDSYASTKVTTSAWNGDLVDTNVVTGPVSETGAIGRIRAYSYQPDGSSYTSDSLAPAKTFTISGVGQLSTSSSCTSPAGYISIPAGTSALTAIYTCSDTRTGTGTITVTAGTSVIGKVTQILYGKVASVTATPIYTIGTAGGGRTGSLSDSDTTADNISGVNTGFYTVGLKNDVAVAIVLKDASGNVVPLISSLSATSSNPAAIATGLTDAFVDDGSSAYSAGFGTIHTVFTAASTAKSGDKASVTYSWLNSDGTLISSAPVALTIGGKVAKETITTDASSYEPGAPMVVTITAVDSDGNPVADGKTGPTLKASKAIGGTLPSGGTYVGGKISNKANTLFAPAVGGNFSIIGTGTDAAATTITATATVEADGNSALALDAANAATDAANNAYDEAQNATQAASDALAAVTALAAQVKSLIASVKKLTTAVAKLKK